MESSTCAVRRFESGAALPESGSLPKIECLILDFDMPGVDVVQLLAGIHAARPGLPTILMTDCPDRVERLPPLDGIYSGLFTKPVDADDLQAAASHILRKSARPSASTGTSKDP